MINRSLNELKLSFFLFGARGTGNTSFLKSYFEGFKSVYIDLLDPVGNEIFSSDPRELIRRIDHASSSLEWVIIDEVLKCPKLLDLVHKLIEERELKFALSGSSARKLRRRNRQIKLLV